MFTKFVYDTPDSTYFNMSNVAPRIKNDCIELTDGKGSRRSWGAPQTTTTVVYENCEFIAVHVGFSHKHRRGQGWFYFINNDSGVVRRTWAQLTEDEQQLVLDNINKAPGWAKNPGTLKSNRQVPSDTHFTAYKILRVVDADSFVSMYDNTTWKLGVRNAQAVGKDAGIDYSDDTLTNIHNGGFYVHRDKERVKELFLNGRLVPSSKYVDGEYALVECECYGRVATFSNGKLAVTYCKPLSVIERFTFNA